MPDLGNMLTDTEKQASQALWDERLAVIKTTTTDTIASQLRMVWLRGKLYDDMLSSPRKYGNRSVDEIAKDLQSTEDALVWESAFYKQYDEKAVEELAASGLAWGDVYALLHFNEIEERENAKVRLIAKKIDRRQALEEADRAKVRKKAQLKAQRQREHEQKRKEDLANDPCSFIAHDFKVCVTHLSDTIGVLERTCNADRNFRTNITKMGFYHRLKVLTGRQMCVEMIGYYSAKFAKAANRIAETLPDLLPNAQPLQPLPVLTATELANLWRDLHSCPVQPPAKKLGKGFTIICKTFEEIRLIAPVTLERLASIDWALKMMPQLPTGDGLQKCIQALMALHNALVTFQRKLGEVRGRLTC